MLFPMSETTLRPERLARVRRAHCEYIFFIFIWTTRVPIYILYISLETLTYWRFYRVCVSPAIYIIPLILSSLYIISRVSAQNEKSSPNPMKRHLKTVLTMQTQQDLRRSTIVHIHAVFHSISALFPFECDYLLKPSTYYFIPYPPDSLFIILIHNIRHTSHTTNLPENTFH